MNKIFRVAFLIFLLGCSKPAFNPDEAVVPDPCDVRFLKVIDPNCIDLQNFLIKPDTTFHYGYSTAIKSVPYKGEIEWTGNNYIMFNSISKQYELELYNFVDTTHWQQFVFHFWIRDNLSLRIDPFVKGKQLLIEQPDLSNYGRYARSLDGGDVLGAYWDLDPSHENYLEITSVSQKGGVVEGIFDVHFRISNSFGNPFSEFVHFRCGKFKAKIFKPSDLWKQ